MNEPNVQNSGAEQVAKLLGAQMGVKSLYGPQNAKRLRQLACVPSEETKAKARKRRKAKAKNAKRNSR